MPELGNKHECYNCGVKFYDFGKSDAICPKCGANQKNARQAEANAEAAARRKRRDDILRHSEPEEEVVPDAEVEGEFGEVALDDEEEADDGFEEAE